MNHRHHLQFNKTNTRAGGIRYEAKATEGGSADLAAYLTASNYEETLADIASTPDDKDVKIGETVLSAEEFKELLQDWLEHIQPITIENEVAKLRKYLMLPITNMVLDDRSVLGVHYTDENHNFTNFLARLYINDTYIGDFPYKSSFFGLMYNMVDGLLDWPKIAGLYHDELLGEIQNRVPLAVSFVPSTYGMLFVKDGEGKFIAQGSCHYQDGKWSVGVSSMNGKVMSKTVSVNLTPPMPDV